MEQEQIMLWVVSIVAVIAIFVIVQSAGGGVQMAPAGAATELPQPPAHSQFGAGECPSGTKVDEYGCSAG